MIQEYMKGCKWQVRLGTIESEVQTNLTDIANDMKRSSASADIKSIKTCIWQVGQKLNKIITSADTDD